MQISPDRDELMSDPRMAASFAVFKHMTNGIFEFHLTD